MGRLTLRNLGCDEDQTSRLSKKKNRSTSRCAGDKGAAKHGRDDDAQVKKLQRHNAEALQNHITVQWSGPNVRKDTQTPPHLRKKCLAVPCCSAVASFSGILAGELASSRTSCQYVLASKKMHTTLTSRNRKYLRQRSGASLDWARVTYFRISENSIQLRARKPC